MKTSCFFLLFVLCFGLSAFSQVKTDSLLVEGHYRSFRFHQPQTAAAKRHLIFVLHGSGGNGGQMMQPAAPLQALAEKEGLLLVYPDGYKKYWNECRREATSEANKEDINEQAFFHAMLQYFGKNYRLQQPQFMVIGLSGGGHMAYKLAMTMPEQCRAISAIVANVPDTSNLDCAEARKPVAVMISNGTEDQLNPYTGGTMIMNGASWGAVRSTERSFQYWATLAGYKGQPVIEALADKDTANGQSITRHSHRGAGKPEVVLLQVNGGGHAFPKDVDIFLESWAFFKRELARKR